MWDEQQPAQKTAYTNFLGNRIAEYLRTLPGLSVKSVRLDDPGQGITAEILDGTDVLIWWGHVRHGEISNAKAKEIVQRIKAGKLSLIALHSAHWSEPFVEAMRELTRDEVAKSIPAGTKTEYVVAKRSVPKAADPLTPRVEMTNAPDGSKLAKVYLPSCVFPYVVADGKPSHVTTSLPEHPIAKGLPAHFDIPQTEMYGEPFHVPKPDAVIFEEKWDSGRFFRGGCLWNLGKGKVFYFRPGHETYPVFQQAETLKIVGNAVEWLGKK